MPFLLQQSFCQDIFACSLAVDVCWRKFSKEEPFRPSRMENKGFVLGCPGQKVKKIRILPNASVSFSGHSCSKSYHLSEAMETFTEAALRDMLCPQKRRFCRAQDWSNWIEDLVLNWSFATVYKISKWAGKFLKWFFWMCGTRLVLSVAGFAILAGRMMRFILRVRNFLEWWAEMLLALVFEFHFMRPLLWFGLEMIFDLLVMTGFCASYKYPCIRAPCALSYVCVEGATDFWQSIPILCCMFPCQLSSIAYRKFSSIQFGK